MDRRYQVFVSSTFDDLREERAKAKDVEPEALLAAYMNEIGKVIGAVDSLEK